MPGPEGREHSKEIKDCVEGVIKSGKEEGNAWAICIAQFKKEGKPIWEQSGKPLQVMTFSGGVPKVDPKPNADGTYNIHGFALHAGKTFHIGEQPEVRIHLPDEMIKASETLAGNILSEDHWLDYPKVNMLTKSLWNPDEQAVEYWGVVDEERKKFIESGECRGVSVELDWGIPGGGVKFLNGFAPYGYKFIGMSLLRYLSPGDPDATIELFAHVYKEAKETYDFAMDLTIEAPRGKVEKAFPKGIETWEEQMPAAIAPLPTPQKPATPTERLDMFENRLGAMEGMLLKIMGRLGMSEASANVMTTMVEQTEEEKILTPQTPPISEPPATTEPPTEPPQATDTPPLEGEIPKGDTPPEELTGTAGAGIPPAVSTDDAGHGHETSPESSDEIIEMRKKVFAAEQKAKELAFSLTEEKRKFENYKLVLQQMIPPTIAWRSASFGMQQFVKKVRAHAGLPAQP